MKNRYLVINNGKGFIVEAEKMTVNENETILEDNIDGKRIFIAVVSKNDTIINLSLSSHVYSDNKIYK